MDISYSPMNDPSSRWSRGFSVVIVVVVTTVPPGMTVLCVSIRLLGDNESLIGDELSPICWASAGSMKRNYGHEQSRFILHLNRELDTE